MRSSPIQGLMALLAAQAASGQEHPRRTVVRLPSQMPAWVERLHPQLAGFSLEMDRWSDWAGEEIGRPNEYFNQILRNLGERTGVMPLLRVGANSQDRGVLDLDVQVLNASFPDPTEAVPNPEADVLFIGRDFYALSGNLPAGTDFMWGINLKNRNRTETVAQARHLADAFYGSRANLTRNVRLVHVEIGNEPNLYTRDARYNASWDTYMYADTWSDYARGVAEEIQLDRYTSGLPGLSPGAHVGNRLWPEWTVEGTLMGGLLDDPEIRAKTSQYTSHGYLSVFRPDQDRTPGSLMNKVWVRHNMTERIHGLESARAAGLKVVLGETNSYANHGTPGLSNTVESAIWAVDWLLLAASRGIEKLFFHHGVGFRYNLVQPISESDDGLNISRPHILPDGETFSTHRILGS